MNILIKDTNVLSMIDDKIRKANIYIKDDEIIEIGHLDGFSASKIIDGRNFITMPGFINAHTHVGMSLFRNYGDDHNLMDRLNNYILPMEEKLTEDIVYNASLLSFAEMIKSGTTTFADMYFFEESTIRALDKARLRAQISRGLTYPDYDYMRLEENIELFKKYNGKDDRLEIALGPHAIYTTGEDYLKKISEVSKKYDMPIHTHLSETKYENDECIKKYNMTPTQIYDKCHIFDRRSIAAHGVYLSDDDLLILKEKNVSIVLNPSSNLKLSSGILDVSYLLDKGINVCLGTDSASSNNKQSMLKEIEMASLISKLKGADNLNSFEVLKMATINGAKALHIDDKVGSIQKGKKADIIMIDIDNINHIPNNNLISSLCYSTYEEDIKYVIINGEIVYEDGRLNYLDLEEIKKEAKKAHEKLL